METATFVLAAINLIVLAWVVWTMRKLHEERPILTAVEKETTELSSSNIEDGYIELINKASEEERLGITRHCFNRLPNSYQLLNMLWYLQKERIVDDELPPLLRRELIRDIDSAVRLYRLTCNVDEIANSERILEELAELSAGVVEKLQEEEEELLNQQLKELEQHVKLLSKDKENKDILSMLEQLDKTISKDRIGSYPALKAKYDNCSEKLISIFTDTDAEKEQQKKEAKYNQKAIESHKNALELFEADSAFLEEHKFKKGQKLNQLLKYIGGWDHRYLLPSTLSYTNTVYGRIFSKMKKDAQLKMTEQMVKAKKKPL
jgi:hypothetical protein